jgi:hypothetical protein
VAPILRLASRPSGGQTTGIDPKRTYGIGRKFSVFSVKGSFRSAWNCRHCAPLDRLDASGRGSRVQVVLKSQSLDVEESR